MFGSIPSRMPGSRLAELTTASGLNAHAFRSNGYLWAIRFLQFLAAIVILGITLANAVDWEEVKCQIPRQLQAIVSIPVLAFLLLATGPHRFSSLPWSSSSQLYLDGFLLSLWLGTTPASSYTCQGVCTGCKADTSVAQAGSSFIVWVGKLTCSCSYSESAVAGVLKTAAVRIVRQARERPGYQSRGLKIVSNASRMAAKQSFDIGMIILFAVTFTYTAYSVFQSRRMVRQRSLGYMSPMRGETKEFDKKDSIEVTVSPVLSP